MLCSQKSSKDATPMTTTNGGDGSMSESSGSMGSQTGSDSSGSGEMGSDSGSGSQALLADGSYLAGLAMGDSSRSLSSSSRYALGCALLAYAVFFFSFLQL